MPRLPRTEHLRSELRPLVERSELRAAIERAQVLARRNPADGDVQRFVAAFRRLVEAAEQARGPEHGDDLSTSPMQGHATAELHLRMANWSAAERIYHRILSAEPGDATARQRLEDLATVRAVLQPDGETFATEAPQEAPTSHGNPFQEPTRRIGVPGDDEHG